jgi:hypothetical protein
MDAITLAFGMLLAALVASSMCLLTSETQQVGHVIGAPLRWLLRLLAFLVLVACWAIHREGRVR